MHKPSYLGEIPLPKNNSSIQRFSYVDIPPCIIIWLVSQFWYPQVGFLITLLMLVSDTMHSLISRPTLVKTYNVLYEISFDNTSFIITFNSKSKVIRSQVFQSTFQLNCSWMLQIADNREYPIHECSNPLPVPTSKSWGNFYDIYNKFWESTQISNSSKVATKIQCHSLWWQNKI